MALDTDDATRIQLALEMDLDPTDGGPLSSTRRAELEAQLSVLQGDPETAEQDQALASLLGGGDTPTEEVQKVYTERTVQEQVDQAAGGVDAQLDEIRQALAALAGGVQQVTQQPQITLADVLAALDPRDSDAALALFGWLWDNQRFSVIGTLNGGGYMLHYQEPKGTTQAGYTAGGTQGSRMVDAAVEKAKAAGAKAVKRGICEKCFSGVREQEDGTVVLDDDENLDAACSAGGPHILHT